jgi:hypothetical protein
LEVGKEKAMESLLSKTVRLASVCLMVMLCGCASGEGGESSNTDMSGAQQAGENGRSSADSNEKDGQTSLNIKVTWSALSVEGQEVMRLDDGEIDKVRKQDEGPALFIPELNQRVERVVAKRGEGAAENIRIETSPLTSYRRFVEVFYTVSRALDSLDGHVEFALLMPGGTKVWREHRFEVPELRETANAEEGSEAAARLPSTIVAISESGFHVAQDSEIIDPRGDCSEGPTLCVAGDDGRVEELLAAALSARRRGDVMGVRAKLLAMRSLFDFAGLYNLFLTLDQEALTGRGLQLTSDSNMPMYLVSTTMAVLARKVGSGEVAGASDLFGEDVLWVPSPDRGQVWVERMIAAVSR